MKTIIHVVTVLWLTLGLVPMIQTTATANEPLVSSPSATAQNYYGTSIWTVFGRNPDGLLLQWSWQEGFGYLLGWPGVFYFQGSPCSFEAYRNGAYERHAFGRGLDNHLLEWYWREGDNYQEADWTAVAGRMIYGDPTAFPFDYEGAQEWHVFGRGAGNSLMEWFWRDGAGISSVDWSSQLGGQLYGDPVAFHHGFAGAEEIHVFGRGPGNSLMEWYWREGVGYVASVDWTAIAGGELHGNPSAFAAELDGAQEIHVFGRGPGNSLMEWYWREGVGYVASVDWTSVAGGELHGDPTAFPREYEGAKQWHVFGQGPANNLLEWYWVEDMGITNVNWTAIAGGDVEGTPSAFPADVDGVDEIHVFGRDSDNHFNEWYWQEGLGHLVNVDWNDHDSDGDNWFTPGGDCNDNDPAVCPSCAEQPGNGVDDDCDGQIDEVCSTVPGLSSAATPAAKLFTQVFWLMPLGLIWSLQMRLRRRR